MQKKPLVSIIIPSFNHQSFIGHAVQSVLTQTYENLECIVIDDGSLDESVSYLKDRFSSDKRFYITTRDNRGAHTTINEGISKASGDYIGILNSDDIYHQKRIEVLLEKSRMIGGKTLLISDIEVIDQNGQTLSDSGPAKYYASIVKRAAKLPDQAVFLAGNVAMTTSNFFFTRSTLSAVGQFRALRYTHDWDWALRTSEVATIKHVKECLLQYRVHDNNTISESDIWKHIVENSVIFSCKLLRDGMNIPSQSPSTRKTSAMAALLQNESFLPIASLYLLATGRTEDELINGVLDKTIEDELKEVLQFSGYTLDILLSCTHLEKEINSNKGKTFQKEKSIGLYAEMTKALQALVKGRGK